MTNDHPLEEQLRRLHQTSTAELDQRIIEAAMPTEHSTQVRPNPARRGRLVFRLSLIAASIIAAMIFYWQSPSQTVWAQVAKAVRKQPWIHFLAKMPDGQEQEMWASYEQQIECGIAGKQVHFENHRLGIRDAYDPQTNTITRTTDLSAQSRDSFLEFGKFFEPLFRGEEEIKPQIAGAEMVNRQRRTVTENGKEWTELTWDVKENRKIIQIMMIRIDPQTRLPKSMTLMNKEMQPPTITMHIDYPKHGPADIYAAGAPRNARFVEKTPDSDLVEIVEAIKRAEAEFDDHRLMRIIQTADSKWYEGFPMLWWNKGQKMRFDGGIERPSFKLADLPKGTTNQREWWDKHLKQYWFMPLEVQDGEFFYFNQEKPAELQGQIPPFRYDPAQWPKPRWTKRPNQGNTGSRMVLGYSTNIMGFVRNNTAILDKQPAEGPPGTFLVTMFGERVWVDPDQGYMTVRREIGSVENDGKDWKPHFTEIVEQSDRSPRGFWYPTRLRILSRSEENGKAVSTESVVQLYYDFDLDLPDSLFQPLDHVIVD